MTALRRAILEPPVVSGVGPSSAMAGLERRTVGFVDVLAQSVGAVAPSAAAATLPALVAAQAQRSLLVCLLLAWVAVGGVAYAVGQFTRRMLAPGSLYTFATKGLGPTAGFATAVAAVVGYGFVAMFGLVGAAFYAQAFLASWAGSWATSSVVTGLAVVLLGLVCAVVLRRGIRLSARVTLVVEVVSIALVALLLAIVLVRAEGDALTAPLRAPLPGVGDLVAGTTVAITAFVGFESAASLGREASRPFLTVPRTIRWTLIVVGLVYLLSAYTQLAGAATFGIDLAGTDVPVNALAERAEIPVVARVLDLGLVASFLACAIASLTALTRVVFSLGREGVLPRSAGWADPLTRTPLGALSLVVPVVVAVPVVLMTAGWSPWRTLTVLIAVSAVGYIASYVVVCAAAPVFLHRIGELTVRAAVVPALVAVALGVVLGVYLVLLAGAQAVSLLIVVVVVALGVAGYLHVRRSRPAAFARMGLFDETTDADLLGRSGSPGDR